MSEQPDGAAATGKQERRRNGQERRGGLFFALLYGGFRPRRRAGRRVADQLRPIVDWHGPALLASGLLVLVLCALDALLTLQLVAGGAREANPFMALFVYGDVRRFVVAKILLTGGGLLALVACARFRVFRAFRAGAIVHTMLITYLILVTYELSMAAGLN